MALAFDPQTGHSISVAKICMVGAGEVGCKVLKNLLLVGFRDIELVDLDTIKVSNGDAQFLYRDEHVGKPKAQMTAQIGKAICPEANIAWYHESVIQSQFNVNFFSRFDIVMNALDNATASGHVYRLCLAAGRPLIESGSSEYLRNWVKKGQPECLNCFNTPGEPIH